MNNIIPMVVAMDVGDNRMFVDCPHCGKQHVHGVKGGLGHRVADCIKPSPGYYIVKIIPGKKRKRKKCVPV